MKYTKVIKYEILNQQWYLIRSTIIENPNPYTNCTSNLYKHNSIQSEMTSTSAIFIYITIVLPCI